MRPIDADAALEAIRTMQTYKLYAGDDMILINKAEVQTELMMLPSVQPETNCSEIPNNWIPCSVQLPEEEGDYLTTTMYGNVFCDYWNGLNFNRTEMVTAWMPLPEPYQAERREDG